VAKKRRERDEWDDPREPWLPKLSITIPLGVKSTSAIAIAAVLIAIAILRGALDPTHLAHLSPAACFAVGLLASLALGLAMSGWRPEVRAQELAGFADRELPAFAQRVLVLAGFASLGLVAIDNHAAARIAGYPGELSEPSPSTYCLPETPEEKAAPPPPPPPEEQPGCALVRRAFTLGYAKTLGDCAPKQTAVVVVKDEETGKEICMRRQLDEPWLHYTYRKLAETGGAITKKGPGDVVGHQVDHFKTHLAFLEDRLVDVKHSITGTPHAAHHVWINLPDPHPSTIAQLFTGHVRCEERFEHLGLWPAAGADRSQVVEHVLGQLLFAARFGTTASCSDFVIHWGAPADACTRLAANPVEFLDGDALDSVRGVLDRRRRQIAVGKLAVALGRPEARPPPPANAVVSLACFVVDPSGTGVATGKTATIDGDTVSLREVKIAAVEPKGAGPIDLYVALAGLFAGTFDRRPGAPLPPVADGADFQLLRADALAEADPFRGTRWPLERGELAEVYPYHRHLHGFIETFRRRFLGQRGRL
jgi:hypothetical protein